jgi:hypothetical protein
MDSHQPGEEEPTERMSDDRPDDRRDGADLPPVLVEPEPAVADTTALPLDGYRDDPEVHDAVTQSEAAHQDEPAARAVTHDEPAARAVTHDEPAVRTERTERSEVQYAPATTDATADRTQSATFPYVPAGAPVATSDAPATAAQQNVVYVTAPQPPKRKSNRGFGALMSVLSTVAFAILLIVLMVIVYSTINGSMLVAFLTEPAFYLPVLFFLIGMIVLAMIINRAGWGAWVIGSFVVGLIVYFGTIGAFLLNSGVIVQTRDVAADMFRSGLVDPLPIFSALLAREVALWTGAIIASRGRKVKARNSDAIDTYQREKAEHNAR